MDGVGVVRVRVPWDLFERVCRLAVMAGGANGVVAELLEAVKLATVDGVALVEVPDDLGMALGVYVDQVDVAWLGLMVRLKKLGEREVRAAREIQRALTLGREVSANVPAMDFTRLRVDGGRPGPVERYGVSCIDEVERFLSWQSAVTALEPFHRVINGTKGKADVVGVVRQVLVDGRGPRELDAELGVRNGRIGEAVARELKRYASMHFGP